MGSNPPLRTCFYSFIAIFSNRGGGIVGGYVRNKYVGTPSKKVHFVTRETKNTLKVGCHIDDVSQLSHFHNGEFSYLSVNPANRLIWPISAIIEMSKLRDVVFMATKF